MYVYRINLLKKKRKFLNNLDTTELTNMLPILSASLKTTTLK